MQQRSPVGCKPVILRLHGMHPRPLFHRDAPICLILHTHIYRIFICLFIHVFLDIVTAVRHSLGCLLRARAGRSSLFSTESKVGVSD